MYYFYSAERAKDLYFLKDILPYKIIQQSSLSQPFIYSISKKVISYCHNELTFAGTIENTFIFAHPEKFYTQDKEYWQAERGLFIASTQNIINPFIHHINFDEVVKPLTEAIQKGEEIGVLDNPILKGDNVTLIGNIGEEKVILTPDGYRFL